MIKLIHSKKLFVVALNSLNYIPEKFINVRTICHPKRIILDFQNLNESSTSIIAPISSMSQKLRNYLNSENKFIFDQKKLSKDFFKEEKLFIC